MNDIEITVVGNVASEITHRPSGDAGPASAWFRLASSTRFFDRRQDRWTDGDTSWFTVYCRRDLADHVMSSLTKGEPVIVTGRVRIRDWERDGRKGTTVGIEARTVGHDLSRGTAAFQRQARGASAPARHDVFDEIVASMTSGETPTAEVEGPAAETAA